MKIICNQSSLNKALNIVSKAITNRSTMPILKGILITTTSNNTIKLTATDSEISIEKECECKVEEQGSIVLSSKLFTEMIKKLPNNEIYLSENEGTVNIKCKSYNSSIVSLSSEEFPDISDIDEIERIILNKETFRKMIKKTSFAASTDESRGVLTGILIEIEDREISMVSIDGFRLAKAVEPIDSNKNLKLIISAKLLNEITKIMSEENEEEDFLMIIDNKKAVFNIGSTKITSRLLEGDFIDYNNIIPKNNRCLVKTDRKELISVIERASLMVDEGKNNLIKLRIDENSILISSRSEEGNINEKMDALVHGEGLEIGFNSKYVIDVVKVIDDDDVMMEFNTNVTPCLIKPEDGNSFEYLILPVRINS